VALDLVSLFMSEKLRNAAVSQGLAGQQKYCARQRIPHTLRLQLIQDVNKINQPMGVRLEC
jgi:hypothetical protein